MRGRWDLTEEEKAIYLPKLISNIHDLVNGNINSIDWTNEDVAPFHLINMLEDDLNYYKHNQETNGWELDFWVNFVAPDKSYGLTVGGCCMTGSLYLGIMDNSSLSYVLEEIKEDDWCWSNYEKGGKLNL